MLESLKSFLDTSDFPARWNCGHWTPVHGWFHICADIAIGMAYLAIPFALARFWWLKRAELEFPKILWLFAAFIFSCGSTHFIEAFIFYHPIYRISGLMKVITALVSWATVIGICRIAPKALELPGLRRANNQLKEQMDVIEQSSEALKKSNRDLAGFTRTVIDDLRNPITGVLFLTEMAQESASAGNTEELSVQLDAVVSRLREMDRFVTELHDRSSGN
ncbi:MAG: histidine kinase dimerization/phospho-acceptor domain-containing protein [Luteolibacter sp.]|uniref:histidine kinase dimerization/phospho-acceptor domain-containing protein n=1 Tax=Luteolibacter sp. TaxID=1962973 RepID=UPI003266B41D